MHCYLLYVVKSCFIHCISLVYQFICRIIECYFCYALFCFSSVQFTLAHLLNDTFNLRVRKYLYYYYFTYLHLLCDIFAVTSLC